MANPSRVLKDISSGAALAARVAELEAALAEAQLKGGKEPYCRIVKRVPKKSNTGEEVEFLEIGGNFFPFSMTRQKCSHIAQFMTQIVKYAKTGKL